MSFDDKLSYMEVINHYTTFEYHDLLSNKIIEQLKELDYKLIVLDDDPTGTQTIHSIPVFTKFDEHTINQAFLDPSQTVYFLTNSRSLNEKETAKLHNMLGYVIEKISQIHQKKYILISRSDSTLRGHYPLEIDTLYNTHPIYNGEILIPGFFEGGRYTYNDIHYVKQGDALIPAHKTEFARDRTFGFTSGHLPSYISEKNDGKVNINSIVSISIEDIRTRDIQLIKDKIKNIPFYSRVIVNALNENDLKFFSLAILELIKEGRNYLFRTAASFVKVISGKPTKSFVIPECNNDKGLIIVGSHVDVTTQQLNYLQKTTGDISFIEFNVNNAQTAEDRGKEINRVQTLLNESHNTVCVYTTRDYVKPDQDELEDLKFSTSISDCLVQIVKELSFEPAFIISKGGITSSDIAVHGLGITKAMVEGQIEKGISIWKGDMNSKFPAVPYIIFPGNVGSAETLKVVYDKLVTN